MNLPAPDMEIVDEVILRALREDMPFGDMTTDSTISDDSVCLAKLIAKEDGVIAGLEVCIRAFTLLDAASECHKLISDGDFVAAGSVILTVSGKTRALLKAERTALNLLQRMSGIATVTRAFVNKLEGTKAKIVDTRKTAPGLRYLDKYSVRAGGGANHRFGLSDGVLIKDNHIAAAGGIAAAIKLARANVPHTLRVEVETESLEMVQEAIDAGADIIMLDNMDNEEMRRAVKLIDGRALTEASGNVTLEKVASIAKTGVDLISCGALTHSVRAMDISMRIEKL